MSIFAAVEMAPRDPIFGLTEQYNADTNPSKVNLGVGVYTGEDAKVPVLKCVSAAQKKLLETVTPKNYLPIDGMALYNQCTQELVFGKDSEAVKSKRVFTLQGLGGTGALKVGADYLKKLSADAPVLISDPSWANHRALFMQAGFKVASYPYYDARNRKINFEGMIDALKVANKGTIIVLHACCQNPTGYDLSAQQWDTLVDVLQTNGLVPFLDMAYQGFAAGLHEDNFAVRKLADAGVSFLLSSSYSKTFSLYGERVGALSVVCGSADEAKRVLSQIKVVVRTNYSNPPTFGAQVVSSVLSTPELRSQWEEELEGMRLRVRDIRFKLVAKLKEAGVPQDMSFITAQNGMFSYLGLTKEQMTRLRCDYSLYGMDSSRICVPSINAKNIDYIAQAIAKVTKS